MSKYYEAYDKRYKQVHDKGLTWSTNDNTEIVETIINKYHLEKENIFEIGCGEGRDARYLLNKDYNVLATDISQEAINYCIKNDINHRNNYKVLDEDRNKYYTYIYNHLKNNGYALILTMGDGIKESTSDITKAFDDTKRTHQETNQEIEVATTSCRIVNFDTLFKEMNNIFEIVEYGVTNIENHFDKIMYILIKKH